MDPSSPRECLPLASPVLDLGERMSTRCRRRPHRLRGGTWTSRTPTWRRWLFSFLRRREDAAPAAVPLRAGQPLPRSFPIPVPAGVAFTVLCCRHLLAPPRVLPQPGRFWVRCPVQVPNLCTTRLPDPTHHAATVSAATQGRARTLPVPAEAFLPLLAASPSSLVPLPHRSMLTQG